MSDPKALAERVLAMPQNQLPTLCRDCSRDTLARAVLELYDCQRDGCTLGRSAYCAQHVMEDVHDERDTLRAEVEDLRERYAVLDSLGKLFGLHQARPDIIERTVVQGVERLRGALETIARAVEDTEHTKLQRIAAALLIARAAQDGEEG
jgi:hypothetical protein